MTTPELQYRSNSQRARVLTEKWVGTHGYCPACGAELSKTANNTKALDFVCARCTSGYELKSRNGEFGATVVDGAYETMIAAIRNRQQPNLFLLSYRSPFAVSSLRVLPKRFLVEPIVVKRNPLSPTARRAGWVGCNLNLKLVPKSALIACYENGAALPRNEVHEQWNKSAALDEVEPGSRGWLTVTLSIVEAMKEKTFSLNEMYAHEASLAKIFPNNRNIRAKLRQQLQILRGMGFIRFNGRGNYELATNP